MPSGYRVAWLGMFENLERAQRHFLIVMPITVALIFGLLALDVLLAARRRCCCSHPCRSRSSAACWLCTFAA